MVSNFYGAGNGGFRFYVIDDLNKAAFPKAEFDSLEEAVGRMEALEADYGAMPALGVAYGGCVLDLVYRVHDDFVLLPEYKRELPGELEMVRDEIEDMVDYLRAEAGLDWGFYDEFLDGQGLPCSVIAPLGAEDGEYDDADCEGKRLKTVSSLGFDSIYQLDVAGQGMVDYLEIRQDLDRFCRDGVLYLDGVRVNYALEGSFDGLDGNMLVSVHDFSRMLQEISKEFCLKVFDEVLGNYYIAASYDTLGEAVQAWYDLPDDLPKHVEQVDRVGVNRCVFNGLNDDFNEIPYELATAMFGIEDKGFCGVLEDAAVRSAATNLGTRDNREFVRE